MRKSALALAVIGVLGAFGGAAFAVDVAPAVFDPASDGVSAPALIPSSRVVPSYPPAALHARYDATVVARAIVSKNGSVGEVEILDISREKLGFEKAVISAMKQWRFEPAQREGESVTAYAWVRLHFSPPNGGMKGFVAADFPETMVESEDGWLASGARSGGGGSGQVPGAGDVNRTAASEEQRARMATYGKPPTCRGCLYDRNALIPPSTYPQASPIGGD